MANPAAATQLSKHPINDTLQRLTDASETKERVEAREVLDENRKAVLDRTFMFSRRLRDLVNNASDADVSFNALNAINNSLTNVASEVSAFFSNKNPGHIDNAASHLDSATSTAAWAFFQVSPKGSRAYGENIGAVEKAASKAIADLEQQHAAALAELAKTKEQISSQQTTLEELRQQIAANQQAGEAAVGEIRTSYQSVETEFRKKMDASETEKATSFEQFIKKVEKQSSDVLSTLGRHEAAAKRIVQIVGNVGVTGNYQNRAKSERDQANYLRFGAIGFFIVGAIILAASVRASFVGEFDALHLIARALVALTISAPAFYLAKESARHRSNADQAKQTELELASLTPFLEALPEEKRQEVIGSLSGAYFGMRVEKHDITHPAELSAEQILKLVVQLLNGQSK